MIYEKLLKPLVFFWTSSACAGSLLDSMFVRLMLPQTTVQVLESTKMETRRCVRVARNHYRVRFSSNKQLVNVIGSWRVDMNINSIQFHQVQDDMRSGAQYVHGFDIYGIFVVAPALVVTWAFLFLVGHPVLHLCPGKEDADQAQNMAKLLFNLEVAIQSFPQGILQSVGILNHSLFFSEGIDQWTMVVDFTGYDAANSPPVSAIFEIIKVIQDRYPEHLAVSLIINPPGYAHLQI